MAITVRYDEELAVVEVAYSGRNSGAEFLETTRGAIELAQRHGARLFLVDTSESEPDVTRSTLHELPARYSQMQLDPRARIAIVQPRLPEALPLARFYETVCVNRGWNARLFETREAALAWLRPGNP